MAQIHPQVYPPPHSSPSPSDISPAPFPNKRPRLSPNPTSPLGLSPSPPHATHSFNLPVATTFTNGASAMLPHGPGTMGPPSRPVEKATDTAELTDVIAQSGIDIKDEEKYLTAYFSQDHNSYAYGSNNALSFNSATSATSEASNISANNSYGELRQFSQNSQEAPAARGLFSQAPVPRKSSDEIAQEEWRSALRRRAQTRSFHLNNPFLQGNALRIRTVKRSSANAVRIPQDGFTDYYSKPPQPRINTASLTGPDGVSVVSATGAFVERDAPLSEILALLSLATGERIRALVEDAAALVMRRRVGSQGLVPVEWSDLAVSNSTGAAVSSAVVGNRSRLDSAVSPSGNPRKRSFSTANNLPTPVSNGAQTPTPPIAFPNELAKQLRGIASKERSAEEARLTKRAKKASTGPTSADGSKSNSVAPGTPGSSGGAVGGGLLGERAPEVGDTKKLTKKEQAKLHSAKIDEAHQHRSANSTANHMLNSGRRYGKTYSWMNLGSGSAGGSGASTPTRLSTVGGGLGGVAGTMLDGVGGGLLTGGAAGRRLGEWREDRDKGAGIQLRDWARVLETESKEKMSTARVLASLK